MSARRARSADTCPEELSICGFVAEIYLLGKIL
jgi:hypothetical protein